MALGKTDFGLYGVVGGLAVFIAFLNTLLSSATSRFYAFAEGKALAAEKEGRGVEGLEESRQWFASAVILHTIVPLVLVAIGYPLGMYAVEHWLTIPPERLEACRWVFRFVCISSFVGMINVPFQAMYVAKQYIAELTIYSFGQTTANVCFMYYMAIHPGDWLGKYALWMCLVAVIPHLLICMRAIRIFPECRLRIAYLWNASRIARLSSFAFWQAFGGLGVILRNQGMQILVNKYFGPNYNASMSIANQVSGQTQSLASAMQGAFQPAIVSALGAGDVKKTRNMSQMASKFALLLTLIFCLPLSVEVKEVMQLWLVEPPPCTPGLCLCMLIFLVVDKASIGQSLACNATGRIAAYQSVGGGLLILCLPLAWLLVACGFAIYAIGFSIVITGVGNTISRVWFSRQLIGMSAKKWLFETIVPIASVSLICLLCGFVVTRVMTPSAFRVVVTTIIIELVFIPLVWMFVLSGNERAFSKNLLKRIARL